MLLTLGTSKDIRWQCILFICCCSSTAWLMPQTHAMLYKGDSCTMKSISGMCIEKSQCTTLEAVLEAGLLVADDITNCGFGVYEEVICCPLNTTRNLDKSGTAPFIDDSSTDLITGSSITTSTTSNYDDLISSIFVIANTTTEKIETLKTPTTTEASKSNVNIDAIIANVFSNTKTTTTTMKPFSINGKQVNGDEAYFDLNKLLNKNDKGEPENDINKNINFGKGNNQNMPSTRSKHHLKTHESMTSGLPMNNIFENPSRGPNVGNQWNVNGPISPQNGNQNRGQDSSVWSWPNQMNRPNADDMQGGSANIVKVQSFNNQQPLWMQQQQQMQQQQLQQMQLQQHQLQQHQLQQLQLQQQQQRPFVSDHLSPSQRRQQMHFHAEQILPSNNPANLFNNNENMFQWNTTPRWAQQQQKQQHHDSFAFPTSTAASNTPFIPFHDRPPLPQAEREGEHGKIPKNGLGAVKGDGSTPGNTNTDNLLEISRVDDDASLRPAVKACRRIELGLSPSLTQHILGGTAVDRDEYPHMAAIGYSSLGSNTGPYEFRCGGALIDSRFVLTAAHCVNSVESQPAVVRLGVIHLNNEGELRDGGLEIKIKRVHIHPNYSSSRKYNDIALLELEDDIDYEKYRYVHPVCLYTEMTDPPSNLPAYVTGWGTTNVSTRQTSTILLKARLDIVPIDRCNATYVELGLRRQLSHGVEEAQMCADGGSTKDACQGDSGGPLNIVLDESLNKYQIVGVVSSGFSCGSGTPGLYARVAAYLDYIEGIVWPTQK